jgi:hypothetical protein
VLACIVGAGLMLRIRFTVRRMWIATAIVAGLALFVAGFVFVSFVFGLPGASALSLLLAPPLVIGLRLRRRRPAQSGRELMFLTILVCVALGGAVYVVWDWYATGMDRDHAEDVKWAEFERVIRRDSAFKDVRINLLDRKHIHWASGTVAAEADLDRLVSLALQCGIEQRLDGPFVHSRRLTVRPPDRARQHRLGRRKAEAD